MISENRFQEIISRLIDAKIEVALMKVPPEHSDAWFKIKSKKEKIEELETEIRWRLSDLVSH